MRNQIVMLIKNNQYKEAIAFYTKHNTLTTLRFDHLTYPPLLKSCANLKFPLHLKILHTHLIKTGHCLYSHTTTALTHGYLKLGFLDEGLKVFDEMPQKNLALFNGIVSWFSRNGCVKEAVLVLKEALLFGFGVNSVSLASLLVGCCSVFSCLQVHCLGIKLGVEMDVYVGTSLVTVYSSCGEIVMATKVFAEIVDKSVVSYNAFVSGLLQNGVPIVVLKVFKEMIGLCKEKVNSVTIASVLTACGRLLYVDYGRGVHGFVVKSKGVCDSMVGTALIDMYAKCGNWELASELFMEISEIRTLVTWNSMVAGFMMNSKVERAIDLFERLGSEGLEPDSATWNSMISGFTQLKMEVEAFNFFKRMQVSYGLAPCLKVITSLLPACAALSDFHYGKEIHGYAIRTYLSSDEFLATALIDMYMKCGCPSLARQVFEQFEVVKPKDPAFWNAMISGYGKNGQYESAFEVFEWMLNERVEPNSATFSSVLSVCSHTGQVDKGWEIFTMIREDYGFSPNSDHFGCMVDLLGRSGQLDNAKRLIQDMPQPTASVFASLLGACRQHLDSEIGEEMAMKLSEVKPEDPTPFVVLSNIYAELGRWSDVDRIRQKISAKELRKLPASSSLGIT